MSRLSRLGAWVALACGVVIAAAGGFHVWQTEAENSKIAALVAGHDMAVHDDATAALLVARARFETMRGHMDAARTIADHLAVTGAYTEGAVVLYELGNAHLRHALDIFSQVPFRLVAPTLSLAKSEYRQAIQLDTDNWDARYNFALVSALVREPENAAPSAGSQMAHERAAWPDIPGAPNGMP